MNKSEFEEPNEKISDLDTDFFEVGYSKDTITPTLVLFFILGVISGIGGSIGILWYERNSSNRFRTIINQLVATGSWFILLYIFFVYIPDGMRFCFGPFSELFCDIEIFIKNVLWSCQLLTLDLILVLRYTFIFHVKNFAVINDDILALILNLSIVVVSIWISMVKRFTPGNLPLSYFLCSGTDPNQGHDDGFYLQTPRKYNTARILLVLTVVLHLIMVPRILYYRIIVERKNEVIELGSNGNNRIERNNETNSPSKNRMFSSSNGNKIILDIVSHGALWATILSMGIANQLADNIEPKEFSLGKHMIIVHFMHVYGPVIGVGTTLILLLTVKFSLFNMMWKKISGIFLRT